MSNIPLRKHPLFFNREHYIKCIKEQGEFNFIDKLFMFGMLHVIHGYAYREVGCRTKEDISNFFSNLFLPKNELGILKEVMFHKYKNDIFKIINLYE